MKILQILRHAKTERLQLGQQDFDRKLTERGLGQMTDLILNQKDSLVNTQHVLVSAAKRTRMTLKTMDKLLEKKTVHYDNALYLASLATLKKQLENQNDNIENLLLIGHNDGLSDFASFLVGDYIYLPTSGYIELELPISSWTHVSKDIASIRAEFYSNFR